MQWNGALTAQIPVSPRLRVFEMAILGEMSREIHGTLAAPKKHFKPQEFGWKTREHV